MTSAPKPLVFLCGHRKSGTTLLANLLDDHPQLAVYPIDLALLYAYFPDYVSSHVEPTERRARLRQILFDDLRRRVDAGSLDVDALEQRYLADLPEAAMARPDALIARLMAAYRAVTGETAKRYGVFKETSIEIYAAEIMGWFPDAHFIHLVRDPRDNFAALAAGVESHYGRMGEDHNRTLASLLNRVRTGFRMGRINRAEIGQDRYLILRFEELATAPEPTMRTVADFLGIEFTPSLLSPTTRGQPTGGNAFDGVRTFEVNSRNVERWRERISPQDAQVIEFHLADEMAEYGYNPVFGEIEQARAAAEFYKWQNYAYFYSDRFAHGLVR